VEIYRSQGLEAVKEKLEEQLTKEEYWKNYLKDKNVDYGYYESKKYILITKKNLKEISLYKIEKDKYNLLLKDNVIVGENQGDKQEEGDLKTPVGAYEFTSKLTKLDAFYGPLALVTSYPNSFDKSLNKNGHGIWLHGMPLNEAREEYTKGCIAIDNPKLEKIDDMIEHDKSVILISDKNEIKASKDEISMILSFIYQWRNAWKDSDINEYIKFYSDSFKRYNGMDFESFKEYKQRVFSKDEKKKIEFSNINIIPYPNSLNKKMYKVLMDEDYRTRSYSFVGKKELYLEVKDNKIQILSEG
jgi:murein L,D-transpeptidase YafK